MALIDKVSVKEKISYALGDGAANIAWRGLTTFLFIFYTDVFGLDPAAVGLLMLVARSSDGVSDILMGIVGDRTVSKYGKFRPWVLWTAVPLAVMLSLLFTSPSFSPTGKIIYAYTTYIIFTLVYTANNIPYGALMGVMTGDDNERTSISSYRMVGAFGGGMLVQGALLFLVAFFGNVDPAISIQKLPENVYQVIVSSPNDIEKAHIKTNDEVAYFNWENEPNTHSEKRTNISFSMKEGQSYSFLVTGVQNLNKGDIVLINQETGYSYAIYLLSGCLMVFMMLTFWGTKERILPPKFQESNLKKDLKDLIKNRPWFILLITGLIFNVYNVIKQGIVVIYFTHYLQNQLLASSYLMALMVASILGAMFTASLSKRIGKKQLFIYALLFSGGVNALLIFCGPKDYSLIFFLGTISEFSSAILPTLFFTMLGDSADYSEYKNGRRATGLVYSAGSFATKLGGGVAGAIIGYVLAGYGYNGTEYEAVKTAVPGIKMLMSYIPTIVAVIGAVFMLFYPLNQLKMNEITSELNYRRKLGTYSEKLTKKK